MDLTAAQRDQIVDQASILMEQLYVHLPLKRALHAVDPVQRLKVLRDRGDGRSDQWFHDEMTATFTALHDLHTTYGLPDPYRRQVAVLPFRLERCFDGDQPRYLVTAAAPGLAGGTFTTGVEVTHWNGVPIARAVERNGDQTCAGNPDARLARGLESLAQRPLVLLPAPVEDWVLVTFLVDGQQRGVLLTWQTVELPLASQPVSTDAGSAPASASIGIDRLVDGLQRIMKPMFAPDKVELAHRVAAGDPAVDLSTVSTLPDVLEFRTVGPPERPVGYLRIRSFLVGDIDAFVAEVVRIVGLLPPAGLIIDVRGNPGGEMAAGERLLQLFTPRPIQPEPCHFISTPLTRRLIAEQPWLAAWRPSMERAVELGAAYSDGHPIEDGHVDRCNALGQRYFGPVALVVDALCYSATDVFAAGFQDHRVGPVIGTDGSTGAGGANAWDHAFLTGLLPELFPALPGGAELTVAVRQTRRVGTRAGDLLEDLGVVPDVIHRMTRADVLQGNIDLIARVVDVLAALPARQLEAAVVGRDADAITIRVTTAALTRVDVFVDDRPRCSLDVRAGDVNVAVSTGGPSAHRVELRGYDGNEVVARRSVAVDAAP